YGRTEAIDNTLNPDFVKKFMLDYFFEERQNLRFDLYDVDSKSSNLSKHLRRSEGSVGVFRSHDQASFLLIYTGTREGISARYRPLADEGQLCRCPLELIGGIPGKKCGTIIVKADELNNCRWDRYCLIYLTWKINVFFCFSANKYNSFFFFNRGIPGKKCGTIIVKADELNNCREVVMMQFCGSKLDKKDFFGKSDPFLVFYRSNEDRTAKTNTRCPLKCVPSANRFFFTLQTHDAATQELQRRRTMQLSGSLQASPQEVVMMQFCGSKLDKKDFFGKSDPFLVFYRSNEDRTFTICHKTEVVKNTLNPVWQAFRIPVRALCNGDFERFTICHKTEVVKNTLNPVWQAFRIPVRALCNGDFERTIKIEVYDWDRDGSHDFIGEFTTSYRELSRGQSQFNVYEVINLKKKGKKKKYLNSGTVTLLSFAIETEVTFLDYITGGTQINFTVAIDFTASNGNPAQPTSLHYMSPYQMNAYAMALKAVGEIIQDYDSDKMFPALGFGAKLPPDGRISHEFALNGNPLNPYCYRIDGVMEAYYQSLKSVHLYGPTNFSPVINHVARYAASVKDGSQYFILLIITDGVISDMAQTKESIVNASTLPMSIIIVGVGPAEFDGKEVQGKE
ncbi:UNVERIFIED_CONTAM: hypothetical protein FKN15_034360, partial [Acipenser sinensis]